MKNGFFHVAVEESSHKYTAFVIPNGQYKFCKIPFGLCNSLAVFQKFVNSVFKRLVRERIVLTYMDDLIISSKDLDSDIENLRCVFETASQANLTVSWKKCKFLQHTVEFLEHVISHGKVRPSELKTESVKKFRKPVNIKQVQAFLGLTRFPQVCSEIFDNSTTLDKPFKGRSRISIR